MCLRNDKQFSTAELHGLGRKHWSSGDWAEKVSLKHQIMKVLKSHAQTSNYVHASTKIQFASGKSDRKQQKKKVYLGLTSSEKAPPTLSSHYTSIIPRRRINYRKIWCQQVQWHRQSVHLVRGQEEVSHKQGGNWVYEYNTRPKNTRRSMEERITEEWRY